MTEYWLHLQVLLSLINLIVIFYSQNLKKFIWICALVQRHRLDNDISIRTEAKGFQIRRVLILTNNALLETIIKNGTGEEYIDNYGFYPDIKKLMNNFEEVAVKVIG